MTLANEEMTLAEATAELQRIQQDLVVWGAAVKHFDFPAVLITETGTCAIGAPVRVLKLLAEGLAAFADCIAPRIQTTDQTDEKETPETRQ
ncbi:MAG TPA: hypothetical protein VGP28_00470 [Methylocella sp.]|jgi:hypothetical protein|nr:hypothetical protein [Methylocella sp.]